MSYRLRTVAGALPFLLLAPGLAAAQAPSRGQAMAALDQPAAAAYTRQQIDQMVAPIALYPDELLTQVLMASTYPQQILDAAQWLQDPAHAGLKGDALVAALQPLPWDPSVKALAAFPQLIVMLSQHIEWTQALGVAFATQQGEVMARVQALRHLAYRTGRIRKVRHLKVHEEGQVIVITTAEPDRVFVPVYNSVEVYGTWPDPGYQPVYLPPPPDFVVEQSEPGFAVSAGFPVIAPLWGWSRPDWHDRRITIDRSEYTRITQSAPPPRGTIWQHQGPVMLTAPTAAPAHPPAAASLPAGTVAPVAAAAVTQLPKRAAAQPGQVRLPNGEPPSQATRTPPTPTPGASPGTPGGNGPEAAPSQPTQAGAPPAGTPPHPAEAGKGPSPAGTAQTHRENSPSPPSPTAAAPAGVPGKPSPGEAPGPAAGAREAKPGNERAAAPTPHPAPPPSAAQAPHPAAPHPAEHPAATATPHPSEPPHPQPPHPAAATASPHPGEQPHPQPPHPAAATASPHPGEPPHAQPPHPAAATTTPHPGEPPHPSATATPHPAEPPHPQPPHPGAAAAPPHPAEPPHPTAAAAPHPAPQPPHPGAEPPHPAAAAAGPHPQPGHAPAAGEREEHKP